MTARTSFQKEVDDQITAHLNNNVSVRNGMKTVMKSIVQEVSGFIPNEHFLFFVKGGTSLNLLKENFNALPHDSKWSDWDTQLLINPTLGIDIWYQYLKKVHEGLLSTIEKVQAAWENISSVDAIIQECMLKALSGKFPNRLGFDLIIQPIQNNDVHELSSRFIHPAQLFDNARTVLDKEPQAHWNEKLEEYFPHITTGKGHFKKSSMLVNLTIKDFYLYRIVIKYIVKGVNSKGEIGTGEEFVTQFRGELLDISIPRRDTQEAMEQWSHVKGSITSHHATGIPIPDERYHYSENLKMMYENYSGISHSILKYDKRVERALDALEFIKSTMKQETAEKIVDDIKQFYPAIITTIKSLSINDKLLVIMFLREIHNDYNLSSNEYLRACVEQKIIELMQQYFYEKRNSMELDDTPNALQKREIEMFATRSFGLSKAMDLFMRQKTEELKRDMESLKNFIKSLNSVVPTIPDYGNRNFKTALTGDFAIILHMSEYKIPCFANSSLFSLSMYLENTFARYHTNILQYLVSKVNNSQSGSYQPARQVGSKIEFSKENQGKRWVFIELSIQFFEAETGPPATNQILGLDVLMPPKLLRDYDAQIGKKMNFHLVKSMRETSEALKKLVTRYS